jgi:hypothetical protein
MSEPSNSQIYEELIKLSAAVASVGATVRENKDHTLAVSRKADEIRNQLGAHEKDPAAHPALTLAEGRRTNADWTSRIGVFIALGALVAKVWMEK